MSENNKVLFFVLGMCLIVATLLAGLRGATLDMANYNEAVFNKRAVLKALGKNIETKVDNLSDEQISDIFDTKMKNSLSIDFEGNPVDRDPNKIKLEEEKKKPENERNLPVFVYEDKGEKFYIVSVRGKGLWDEIWGNIALKSDLETVAGVSFDHKGETPGLGAEIKDNQSWVNQFVNTSVFRDGEYVGVNVRKGKAKDKKYEVDGLSGATVTGNGVTDMLRSGIANYEPYFNTLKAGTK